MQYPYLTFLNTITVLLTLFVGTIIFYFLIKESREIKFLTALKAIVLYELASLLLYLIYPFRLLSSVFDNSIFKILDLLIFGIILFFIFYFIMKKILSISWKKSLIAFLLVVLIIFPFLSFLSVMFVQKTYNLPVFAEERSKSLTQIEEFFFGERIFPSGLFSPPLSFKILGTIEEAMFSWPSVHLFHIIIGI